jgi:penicillin-insensitive murein endopeptidase
LQQFSRFVVACLLVILLGPVAAVAEVALANKLFSREAKPFIGASAPIGSYARGCATGLIELPKTGPTWQAMRLSRNRNFGHPEMINFLKNLSQTAHSLGWAGLYFGDISQPRGGPMSSGHTSHQIGLDADIWMLAPKSVNLTRAERELISSISVRSDVQRTVTNYWSPTHQAVMRAAALDPRVDRLFVAAAVKIAMCKTANAADKVWLQKIRPWSGHNTHFHVRLKCPDGAALCKTQTPSVAELSNGGDGCDATLNYWVTDYLKPRKIAPPLPNDKPKRKTARQFTLDDLPKQCAALVLD